MGLSSVQKLLTLRQIIYFLENEVSKLEMFRKLGNSIDKTSQTELDFRNEEFREEHNFEGSRCFCRTQLFIMNLYSLMLAEVVGNLIINCICFRCVDCMVMPAWCKP